MQQTTGIDLHATDVEPFTALCFTTQTTLQAMNEHNHIPEELYAEADRLGLFPAGPIHYVYTDVTGNPANAFQLNIVLPIERAKDESNVFSVTTFRPFRCVSYTHTGSWSEFPTVYNTLFAQFYGEGYQGGSIIREVYVVVDIENPANCVTEIQIERL
ncbi:GyrI-like domain-containing protein [Spirosoma fluminis]